MNRKMPLGYREYKAGENDIHEIFVVLWDWDIVLRSKDPSKMEEKI